MDISKIFGQAGGVSKGLDGKSLAAGAAMGGAAGLFANSRMARRMKSQARHAMRRHGQVAGLALIGGLAYKAYADHKVKQAQQASDTRPEPTGFITDESAANIDAEILVLRAMIAAASADGEINAKERDAIMAEVKEMDLPKSAMGQLMTEMSNPASPTDIAHDVTSIEQAVQVYTAANLTIDVDTDEERQFLDDLAFALNMPASLVAQVNKTVADL
ncbi:MAG: tellurite resistance TerB family protein [Pseudomonadota bacterium]